MTTNFNLKINSKPGKVVFFALPTSNNYQEILNLSYDTHNNELIADNSYANKILAIKAESTNIRFTAILKSQTIQLNNLGFNFNSKQKELIKKNEYINGTDTKIQTIAKSLKKIQLDKTINDSYEFVINYLNYGNPQDGLYSYQQALGEKITDCGGFSTLLASILNANQIPTRLVIGFLIKRNISTKILSRSGLPLGFNNLSMHAWIEALLPDNTWFPMDPSIDWKRRKGLTTREGGFGFIPADRLVNSFGENFMLNFDNKQYEIPILQNPLSYNS